MIIANRNKLSHEHRQKEREGPPTLFCCDVDTNHKAVLSATENLFWVLDAEPLLHLCKHRKAHNMQYFRTSNIHKELLPSATKLRDDVTILISDWDIETKRKRTRMTKGQQLSHGCPANPESGLVTKVAEQRHQHRHRQQDTSLHKKS